MGIGRRMVAIDSEKLRKELAVRKLTLEGVSIDLGYGKTYIANSLRLERISNSVAQMLKMMYNIDPNSYIIKDEPKSNAESEFDVIQNPVFETITKDELYTIIYTATYEAFRQALLN